MASVGLLGAILLLSQVFRAGGEERGEGVSRVDWLPPEATDVTFAKRSGFGWYCTYECSIPREAFERFAAVNEWTIKHETNVTNGNRHILFPSDGSHALTQEALVFERRQPNGGGVTVIYDLVSQRLFVEESHR